MSIYRVRIAQVLTYAVEAASAAEAQALAEAAARGEAAISPETVEQVEVSLVRSGSAGLPEDPPDTVSTLGARPGPRESADDLLARGPRIL